MALGVLLRRNQRRRIQGEAASWTNFDTTGAGLPSGFGIATSYFGIKGRQLMFFFCIQGSAGHTARTLPHILGRLFFNLVYLANVVVERALPMAYMPASSFTSATYSQHFLFMLRQESIQLVQAEIHL